MKFKNFLNENKIKSMASKFNMKMRGSGVQTSIGWIDGLGEFSDKEKQELLKYFIKNDMMILPAFKSNKTPLVKQINKDYPWTRSMTI